MQRKDDGLRIITDATKKSLRSAPIYEPQR